jgi:hypothetical protein
MVKIYHKKFICFSLKLEKREITYKMEHFFELWKQQKYGNNPSRMFEKINTFLRMSGKIVVSDKELKDLGHKSSEEFGHFLVNIINSMINGIYLAKDKKPKNCISRGNKTTILHK